MRPFCQRLSRTSPSSAVTRQLVPRKSYHRNFWHRQNHGNAYPSQRVEIMRPRLNSRRLVTWCLYSFIFYSLYRRLILKLDEIVFDESSETDSGLGEVEEVDEDGNIIKSIEGDSIFIPMQLPHRLPRSFYKGSDPEWQEFIRFNKDQERTRAIRAELAGIIGKELAILPQIRSKLGKSISARKYWLDIQFPDRPPPEYERSGLEVNDDYIAWSTQVIPQSQYVQLQKLLWPGPVFQAATRSLQIFYYLQSIKVKSLLGIKLTPRDQQIAQLSVAAKAARERSGPQSNLPSNEPSDISIVASDSTNDAESRIKAWLPGKNIIPAVPTDMGIASAMFMDTLNKLWRNANVAAVPRGCFYVVGLVELIGSHGRCIIDVQAAYDPKARQYVSISAATRHFWLHRQSPKGGS